MHTELPVSNREFARMVGQSEGAVRKAIARQSIKEGLIDLGGKQRILPVIAAAEWGKVILPQEVEPVAVSIDLPVPVINDDVKAVNAEEIEVEEVSVDVEELADDEELRKSIPTGITKAEADRRLSVLRARKAQIELDELEGRLVDKQVVFQNLAEMGIMIREVFMNLPARHLDVIVAADSRNEQMILFENAIADALKSLVALDNVNFEKR